MVERFYPGRMDPDSLGKGQTGPTGADHGAGIRFLLTLKVDM